jgi:predicted kinase
MWQLTNNKNWNTLNQQFDWVRDMQGVQQDAKHHAEGNVAIHTQMVIQELEQLPEYQTLNQQEKEILWASALMHDIEKRSTTVIEADGGISSKNHAKRGEFTTRKILYCDIPTPFVIREQVAKLVRYHGLPLWAIDKPNPQKAVLQASLEVNTQWLYILAKADALGRICQDQQDLLYRLELFKELCLENDCWCIPKVFTSPLARFEYFYKEDKSPDYQAFDDTKTSVILLSGLPGTGKDTYVRKHLPEDYAVVCLDDFRRELGISPTDTRGNGRVVQLAKESAKSYMRNRIPFVWNATNLTRQMREQLIDMFVTYKAKVKIVYLEVPFGQQQKQNTNREHAVPGAVIERMINKLEMPQVWEAHEVEYILS